MKPHFKKNFFGEKTCLIKKTLYLNEAYLTNFDYRHFTQLPELHTLEKIDIKRYIFSAFGFIPVIFFSSKLISHSSSTEVDKYSLLQIYFQLFLAIGFSSLVFFTQIKANRRNSNLTLTFDYLSYEEFKVRWKEVIGIYEVFEKSESGLILSSILIKTKDMKHFYIKGTYTKLSLEKLPRLISAYKWKWDYENRLIVES